MSVGDLPSAKNEAAPKTVRAIASAPPAAAEAPAAPPSLAEEMKSAEAIRAAAREGRTADAIRLLDEHDARFPTGALAEETLVLRIETFAKAGRASEAKALAAKFITERPKSPYAPRVRSTMSRLE
jgi:TolA-binding protein